ncbi:PepSY-like domain-containing protein [Maribacter sp. 2307ULW6-5]|uniref:PepSY-like domain-containing protein n=1 Tax=Maribacter sp. 2307ULW6-5 TaxID=3386275 RepID=UPI0039BC8B4C
MKTLKTTVMALLAAATMNAQDLGPNEVPQSFTDGLKKMYPEARDIEWERNGTDYKVEFHVGRMEHEIWFNKDGKHVRVEKEITTARMPAGLLDIIERDYPDHKIDSVESIEKDGQTTYEVELEKSWNEEIKIVYTTTGKVLSVVRD